MDSMLEQVREMETSNRNRNESLTFSAISCLVANTEVLSIFPILIGQSQC